MKLLVFLRKIHLKKQCIGKGKKLSKPKTQKSNSIRNPFILKRIEKKLKVE